MVIGGGSNRGLVRETNQDSMYIPRMDCIPLFIVADGMGGHKAGEIASKLTVDIIRKEILDKSLDVSNVKDASSIIKGAIEVAKLGRRDGFLDRIQPSNINP